MFCCLGFSNVLQVAKPSTGIVVELDALAYRHIRLFDGSEVATHLCGAS